MISNNVKHKAADSLNEVPVKFQVRAFGLSLKFSIKKLHLGTLIQISKEQTKLSKPVGIPTKSEVIDIFKTEAKPKARIIALAVVDNKFKPFIKYVLTWLFLKSLTSEELNKLTDIVIESMGINDFFQSTVSLKGIDLLNQIKSKTVTNQHSPSGEE